MCSCHARHINAPIWHPLLGCLFFSYRGSLIVGRGCDSINAITHQHSLHTSLISFHYGVWHERSPLPLSEDCLPSFVSSSLGYYRPVQTCGDQNDVGRLQSLLGRGLASPSDIRYDGGSTPLQFAINLMRVEVCEFLVSIGSNPFALSHSRTLRYVRKIVQPHCATNQFRSAADLAWDFLQYASTPSKFKDAMRRLLPRPKTWTRDLLQDCTKPSSQSAEKA
jgi:hypothetical protein